ncbi:MAG: hypothetical protein ACLGQW_02115 [Acidobacteriota bacterium]
MSDAKKEYSCRSAGQDNLESFPYVRLTPEGDLVIPANRVDEFVRKYLELSDNREHMERLRAYLTGERKCDPAGTGD